MLALIGWSLSRGLGRCGNGEWEWSLSRGLRRCGKGEWESCDLRELLRRELLGSGHDVVGDGDGWKPIVF